jgi:hypothetical protein
VFDVALSVFARAVVRLRVLVALTCSFASGVSDVLLMEKTPFYITIRLLGGGNLSSQPQKRTVIFPYWEETDPLVGAVPGISIRLRSLASWLLCLIGHSCRSANIAKTALQTVGCASIKSREKMTHTFVSILIQPARSDVLMVIIELN